MLSTSPLINREALDSQIYNPSIDPKVLMLQQIMENEPQVVKPAKTVAPLLDPSEVEFDLQEHVATFNSLPTNNPFQGVIVNPLQCLIDPVRTDLSDLNDYMNGRFSDNGTWGVYRQDFQNDCQDINDDLDCIEDHSDRLTSNLPSLTGIAQAFMALDTVMNLLSNPCLGLDNFFGSIRDKGKQILAGIRAKIQPMIDKAKAWVDANIGPLIDSIKDAIAQAKAAIQAFVAAAKEEIAKFAKALRAQIRQGLAELMASLGLDPCMQSMLKDVAKPAALAVLGG